MKWQAVFFDLDGTLIDTAPDMVGALNRLLADHHKPPLPYDAVRPYVSHGSYAMVRMAFGEDAPVNELRDSFLRHYEAHIAEASRLFPGMPEYLATLEENKIPWGIVTNKPEYLTHILLDQLQLSSRAASVVGGDTLAQKKPDPAPMFLACEQAGVEAKNCLYVGDAERDIQAGRAAGMKTVAARYGYLLAHEDPNTWGADWQIDSADALFHI